MKFRRLLAVIWHCRARIYYKIRKHCSTRFGRFCVLSTNYRESIYFAIKVMYKLTLLLFDEVSSTGEFSSSSDKLNCFLFGMIFDSFRWQNDWASNEPVEAFAAPSISVISCYTGLRSVWSLKLLKRVCYCFCLLKLSNNYATFPRYC